MTSADGLGIYIFRRDLRVHDNLGLAVLSSACETVLPVYILDPAQVTRHARNKHYFSNNAVQFMCESLHDLDAQLGGALRVLWGDPTEVVERLIRDTRATALGFNADFSAFSLRRDNRLRALCKEKGIRVFEHCDDYTLLPSDSLLKADGSAYRQFGAFYKQALRHKVGRPHPVSLRVHADKVAGGVSLRKLSKLYKVNDRLAQRGGRARALDRLAGLSAQKGYNDTRDLLSVATTGLSAYLNFGCVSVREVYAAVRASLGPRSGLLKQLYWRDFFLMQLRFVEHATSFKRHMDERFDKIRWRGREAQREWELLMAGETGFLLVDACMREMLATGFMHNRGRMLVGVFWTKYLRIHIHDPEYGSQVGFSRHLVDAIGPSQNKMNHHWITELDAPGRRYAPAGVPLAGRPMDIGNRMIKKWDPEGEYVKRWLPHLNHVTPRDLYKWSGVVARKYGHPHPAPMFDPKQRYSEWVAACRSQ